MSTGDAKGLEAIRLGARDEPTLAQRGNQLHEDPGACHFLGLRVLEGSTDDLLRFFETAHISEQRAETSPEHH